MERVQQLTRPGWARVAVSVLIGALFGLAAGAGVIALQTAQAQRDLVADLSAASDRLDEALQRAASPAIAAGGTPELARLLAEEELVVGAARWDRDGEPATMGAAALEAVWASSTLTRARAQATDRAETVAPVLTGDSDRWLITVAASFTGDTPSSVAERRATVEGWSAVAVDGDAALASITASLPSSATTSLRDGVVVLQGDPAADQASSSVHLAERTLTVGARAGDPSTLPVVAAVVLGALVGLGTALYSRSRAGRVAELAQQGVHAELDAVAEISQLVQESLALSDVLPAVCTRLSQELDLNSIAVFLPGPRNMLVAAFSVGTTTTALPWLATELPKTPSRPRAGESFTVPLIRASRVVGALELVCRRDLDNPEMRLLRVTAELIGAAVVNADLFKREQEAAQRLQSLDTLKNEFIGTVSHELRTPVTAINGFASVLDSQWDSFDDEQRRNFIGRIARNGASISQLVQDLLDFARLERRSVTVITEPVDLLAIIEQVVDQIATMTDDHTVTVQADDDVWATADPSALERVLTNLLTNATKYSPPGTTVTVTVASRPDRSAVITVDDEGEGIADADAHKVFERFYRGSSEAVLRTRGTGVGLAVVKELVDRMGGTVTVSRSPAGGARMSVVLPATDAHEPEDAGQRSSHDFTT